MYRRLPIQEKLNLIKRAKSGENIAEICRQNGISRTIFYKWLRIYIRIYKGRLKQKDEFAKKKRYHRQFSKKLNAGSSQ